MLKVNISNVYPCVAKKPLYRKKKLGTLTLSIVILIYTLVSPIIYI